MITRKKCKTEKNEKGRLNKRDIEKTSSKEMSQRNNTKIYLYSKRFYTCLLNSYYIFYIVIPFYTSKTNIDTEKKLNVKYPNILNLKICVINKII